MRIGEEDTIKRKKVTIASSKKEKNKTEKQRKQTKESSGPSWWVPSGIEDNDNTEPGA